VYARVTTLNIAPDQVDGALRLAQEGIVPVYQQQRGFQGLEALLNRSEGRILVVSIWATKADAIAAGEALPRAVPQEARDLDAALSPRRELYEVAVRV